MVSLNDPLMSNLFHLKSRYLPCMIFHTSLILTFAMSQFNIMFSIGLLNNFSSLIEKSLLLAKNKTGKQRCHSILGLLSCPCIYCSLCPNRPFAIFPRPGMYDKSKEFTKPVINQLHFFSDLLGSKLARNLSNGFPKLANLIKFGILRLDSS